MFPPFSFKSGLGYGLSYITASVICALLIVIGNDLLMHSALRGFLADSILEIDYRQWLRFSAINLGLSFALYLVLYRLLLYRLPLLVSALCCGLISAWIAFGAGIGTCYSWYELKNILTFFIAGCAFGLFSRLLH